MVRKSERGIDLSDTYEDADTIVVEQESIEAVLSPDDVETVLVRLNDAENRRTKVDFSEENIQGYALLNEEMYDLQKKYGSSRLYDDIRREVLSVLKEIERPQYRLPETRKAILDEAVKRAKETDPDSKESKDAMDEYIENLLDHGTSDLSDKQKSVLSEHLKTGEYWKRSKADIRSDFSERMKEWIRRGIFGDEIKKTK